MARNAGDQVAGRFKAKVTRQLRRAAPVVKPLAETPDTTLAKPAAPSTPTAPAMPSMAPKMKKVQKSRTYRMLGSMKYGGRIHKTGLYLMHAGEHVRSPYKRG